MERKILKLLSFFFVMFACLFIKTNEVSATTLKLLYVDNVYYSRYGGGIPYSSDQFHQYSLDGHLGYCIEPGKNIFSYEYTGSMGLAASPYNDATNKLIQLIGYYGYEYPGHQTTRYSMATQALIWEKAANQTVRFYTERYDEGEELFVNEEKAEIMRLVNTHTTKPDFGKTSVTGTVGQEITLEDKNQVLEFFTPSDSNGNKVRKEGNKLIITPVKVGTSTITLKKPKYDNTSTMVFSPNVAGGQKVAVLRYTDEVSMQLTLTTKGSKLKVIKIDAETGNVIKKAGIKFKLKDLSTKTYVCENSSCTFETNNNGEFTTNTYLNGDYELEEVNMPIDGYLWNSSKLKVHIDANTVGSDNVMEVKFTNHRVKGRVVINKVGEKAVNQNGTLKYENVSLASVIFGLYAADNIYQNGILIHKKDALVKILVTDSKGYVECNNLYLGRYYIKEIDSLNGYLKDPNKYEFNLTYQNQNTEVVVKTFNLTNYLQKGKIVINKVGEKLVNSNYESASLANVKYNVYALEDIKINGSLVYKKDGLVTSLITDSNGHAESPKLPLGKYYVVEVSAPKDYIVDSKRYEVTLTANSSLEELVTKTLNLKNTLRKGKVIIKKLGEKLVSENNSYTYEDIPLKGVKYGLYADSDILINGSLTYKKDTLIKTVTTNYQGQAEITNLPLGNYYLLELETRSEYIKDNTKHEFTLSNEKPDTELVVKTFEFKNYLKKGNLVITKVGEKLVSKNNDYTYEDIPLKGVKYGLYASSDIYLNEVLTFKKDALIKTVTTNDQGQAEISNLPLGNYYLIELETRNEYIKDNTKHEFTLSNENPDAELVVKNFEFKNYLKKGNLLITKVGEKVVPKDSDYTYEEMPLEGVKYGLYADSDIYLNGVLTFKKDTLIKTIVTNSKGIAEVKELPLGKYYVKELKTIDGYILDNKKYEFELTLDNLDLKFETKNLVFKNYLKKGKFSINKVGEKVVVDNTDYYFEEVPLKGVRYGLYAADDIYTNNKLTYKKDDLIKVLVTDSNGEINITDLVLGKYYVRELETPNDFLIDKQRYDIDLTEDDKLKGQDLVLKNYLKKGTLIINKNGERVILDEQDYHYEEMPLSGVKYGLYADADIYKNGNLVYKKNDLIKILTTNEKGQIEVSDLVLGNYYVLELRTTTDSILDLSKHEFELRDKESEVVMETLNLKNYLKKGKLVVSKVGEEVAFKDGDYHYEEVPLGGVKYAIYANDDVYTNGVLAYHKGDLVKVIETDVNGNATLDNLPLGSYYIVEIATKDGYVLDSTKYEFTLTDKENEVMMKTLDLENHLKKGRLEFYKIDSKTNEPIPETLIEIYKEVNGEAVLFFRGYTDINGMITLNDLPLGRYLLREVNSSQGYKLSNEVFTFDITTDGDTEYITMENDKIEEVKVPSTGANAPFFFKLAGLILFLGGSVLIAYTRRRETND